MTHGFFFQIFVYTHSFNILNLYTREYEFSCILYEHRFAFLRLRIEYLFLYEASFYDKNKERDPRYRSMRVGTARRSYHVLFFTIVN